MARRGDGSVKRVWRERLRRYRGCGVTVAAFCAREGVSTASFYAWRRRLGESSAGAPGKSPVRGRPAQPQWDETAEAPLFVPVSLEAASSADVQIALPGGAVVRIPAAADEGLLRRCIRAATLREPETEAERC